LVHPREVLKPAILANAHRIILAHNHPSGNLNPSISDIEMAKRMIAAGDLLGIKVVDFIIVGDGDYYSFERRQPSLFCGGTR
jgi:DNA repair protein RadC